MGLSAQPSAIVLDTLAAPLDPDFDAAVGLGAAPRLRRELRAIALRWAAALAPDRAFEANSPAAAMAALDGHDGPLVLVAPDIPWLAESHARAVLGDLGSGIGIVVGAGHDARPFLVGLATPDERLVELAGGPLDELFRAAAERELAMSMIRHERRLASAADARALALDPLAPPELVAQLGRLRPR